MILETTDGGKYGMRHMNEMWVKVYKAAFAKDAGLEGKTVNRITYIMSDGAYVYEFADGIYIKPQATEEMDVSPEFTDSTHVKLANLDKYKNPKVSVFYTTDNISCTGWCSRRWSGCFGFYCSETGK